MFTILMLIAFSATIYVAVTFTCIYIETKILYFTCSNCYQIM